jgi:FtsP/CotA-like multicopper oxidase with cupredoxin domain
LTYTFPATQYGTTWYHSHYALQYAEGLYGPLIINGPTTANYGEDLGALMVADWDHTSVFKLWDKVKTGGPPSLDNTLLNGTNVYDCTTSSDAACLGTGKYFEVVFVEGTSYKLRIINAGTDMHFRFQIDAHNFQVVAMDLVPIVPYTTDNLLVAIGQRYDIIVNANATNGGDFWLRAVWQTSCGSNLNAAKSLGIVRYNASSTADPTTTPATTYASACTDEPLASLVPYYAMNATASTPTSIAISSVAGSWEINGGTLQLNWSDPTILMDYQNESIFPTDYNVFPLPTANVWVSFIITATGPGAAHPIHLHGHDFWILGQASTAYSATTTVLNYNNPPRRDVATLIPGGYLAIAFITDNPGSWLAHCHIAWHASESLAWQFVERESEITGTLTSADTFLDTCASWETYYTPTVPQEDDSGI